MCFCSRQVCFKELKIKLILRNFKHGAQRSHSGAYSLKKCTLPYIYFAFKCLVLYFGIKKEWLEKSLNTFSLAANILKTFIRNFYRIILVKCLPLYLLLVEIKGGFKAHYKPSIEQYTIQNWEIFKPTMKLRVSACLTYMVENVKFSNNVQIFGYYLRKRFHGELYLWLAT